MRTCKQLFEIEEFQTWFKIDVQDIGVEELDSWNIDWDVYIQTKVSMSCYNCMIKTRTFNELPTMTQRLKSRKKKKAGELQTNTITNHYC